MNNLQPIENNGQRVLTTAQIAEMYGTDSKILSNNFNRNKERYIENKHYYCLTGAVLREFKANHQFEDLLPNSNKYYLWTEKGALLHAKSLNTDKAWAVYDELVETYFRVREAKRLTGSELMAAALIEAHAVLEQKDQQITTLSTTVAVQEQQIAELQPKASYYDVVLQCKDLIATSVIAKDYGKSAKWLNNYLHDKGVQFKQSGIWLLYQKYAEHGYTSTKTCTPVGCEHAKVHTYWTQKGRLFIYGLLKADGILPIIEQGEAA